MKGKAESIHISPTIDIVFQFILHFFVVYSFRVHDLLGNTLMEKSGAMFHLHFQIHEQQKEKTHICLCTVCVNSTAV